MHYRTEIDGLRALAIIPVIWSHAGLPYVTGGFLGVDVFFVISGFLITTILLKEFQIDNFSLTTFYERRARRILPALFVMLMVTSICVLIVSDNPAFVGDYGASVLSTIFFGSNLYFWQTSGYFGTASELSPMLHTWSLAVEEQFYIFFPLLIMALFSRGRKAIICVLIVIFVGSLLISEWGAINSPVGNFYLLPSRAWELMAGALAAVFYLNHIIVKIRDRFSIPLSLIGIILILSSYLLFTPSTLHPSKLTMFPVLGAALILLFSEKRNAIGKILSIKPLSLLGLISYSLYLWHQPILALMKKRYSVHLEPSHILVAIILTFTLSYLTWKYVETPFRNREKYTQKKIFKLSFLSIALVLLTGLLFKENLHIQKSIFPEKMERYAQISKAYTSHINQVMYDDGDCKFWSKDLNNKFIKRFDKCTKSHGKAIFILGGSHGMDLYNAISMNATYPFIVSVSQGNCRAHKFIGDRKDLPNCQYEDFKLFVATHSDQISYVIYTQTPDRLFKFNNVHNALHTASTEDLSLERLDEVVNYLSEIKEKYSLNIFMIGMLPPLQERPIDWNYSLLFTDQFDSIISENSINLTKFVDDEFTKKLQKHGIPYISKFEGFSLNMPKDLIIEGNITYSDGRHLSYYGEKIFGERLIDSLTNKGYKLFNGNK